MPPQEAEEGGEGDQFQPEPKAGRLLPDTHGSQDESEEGDDDADDQQHDALLKDVAPVDGQAPTPSVWRARSHGMPVDCMAVEGICGGQFERVGGF